MHWFPLTQIEAFLDDGEYHYSIRFGSMPAFSHDLHGLVLFGALLLSGTVQATVPLSIEAFTAGKSQITGVEDERLRVTTVTTYTVDGLERFESGLSEGLPQDPEAAKAEALRRVQQLDDPRMAPAKNAAIGLAKAIQYGIDRYPAIVLNERAVVYGVTDLVEALKRYEAWQREQAR